MRALWVMVGHWNAWFDATIYINDADLYPLQVVLRRILLEGVQTMLSDIEEQEAEEAFSKYAGYSLEDVYRELVEEDNTPGKGK